MPDKMVAPQENNGFWSSPWTIAIATTILGDIFHRILDLVFQFPAPVWQILKFVGFAVLILGGILVFGLAQQSVSLGRVVGAVYGFMIGSVIGGLVQDYAQPLFPLFAPHPSVSLLNPPVGEGLILWLAWGAPIIGAFVGAHIRGRKYD
jgi:hypothetical protein